MKVPETQPRVFQFPQGRIFLLRLFSPQQSWALFRVPNSCTLQILPLSSKHREQSVLVLAWPSVKGDGLPITLCLKKDGILLKGSGGGMSIPGAVRGTQTEQPTPSSAHDTRTFVTSP